MAYENNLNLQGVSSTLHNSSSFRRPGDSIAGNVSSSIKGMLEERANIQNKIFLQDQAEREAMANIAGSYRPYGEDVGVDNTKLDAMTKGTMNAFIGDQTPIESRTTGMEPAQDMQGKLLPGKTMPSVDQELYNRQSALQSMYERQRPSQESAYDSIVAQSMAKGVDPIKAAAMAKSLTGGLTSEATTLSAAQARADALNKMADMSYKEDRRDFRKGISSGSTGDKTSSNPTTKLSKISPNQWIGGDRSDALARIDTTKNLLNSKGWSSKDVDKILSNALEYSSGKTDWTNDDVEFNDSMFNDYMARALKDPKAAVNEYKGSYGSKPALPERLTAYDVMNSDKVQREASLDKEFAGIVAGYKKPTAPTVSVKSPEEEVKEGVSTATGSVDPLVEAAKVIAQNKDKKPDEIVAMVNKMDLTDEEKINIIDNYNAVIGDDSELYDNSSDIESYIKESSGIYDKAPAATTDKEYTKDNFPGTKGEYEEYAVAKADSNPSTLQKFWRDLTEPGYFANRVKKIEKEEGADAAAVAILFDNGPAAIGDVVGAGGLFKWLLKKGATKAMAKQAVKEAKEVSDELTGAIGNRMKEAAARRRLEVLRNKYNLQGAGTRGRKLPTEWKVD